MEGELGIDTVKQAEIMAEIRERFALPVDEEFVLSDYPTLNHMIGYIKRMGGPAGATPQVSAEPIVPPPVPAQPPSPVPPAATAAASKPAQSAPQPTVVDAEHLRTTVVEVVVIHTGYPADIIELDHDHIRQHPPSL